MASIQSQLDSKNVRLSTLSETTTIVKRAIQRHVVPFLTGQPGIGKSAITHALCSDMNLCLIDLRASQMQPEDANGFPAIIDGVAQYITFENFPVEGTPLPVNAQTGKTYDGWVIMYDELPHASEQVFASLYKLIHDRKVNNKKLHHLCYQIAAGNRMEDNALGNFMGTALKSRLLEIQVKPSYSELMDYFYKAGFDPRITAFLTFKPEYMNTFDPTEELYTFACPRTWEMNHRMLSTQGYITDDSGKKVPAIVPDSSLDFSENWVRAMVQGVIGPVVAGEFCSFLRVQGKIPTYDEIINDPTTCTVPKELALKYAVASSLASNAGTATNDDIDKVCVYLDRIPQPEPKAVFYRTVSHTNPRLYRHEGIRKGLRALKILED